MLFCWNDSIDRICSIITIFCKAKYFCSFDKNREYEKIVLFLFRVYSYHVFPMGLCRSYSSTLFIIHAVQVIFSNTKFEILKIFGCFYHRFLKFFIILIYGLSIKIDRLYQYCLNGFSVFRD